jgi:hypothetical protein
VPSRDIPEKLIRCLDRRLAALTRMGVEMKGPGWFSRFRTRAAQMRAQDPEREAVRTEIDALLPQLLSLYTAGDDADRQRVRDILRECPIFRWALGWPVARPKPPVTEQAALTALALLSMTARLDLPPLLRQAASWSSDVQRFPRAASTRALLQRYAERFATQPPP